jgi:hypothetical protein
MRKCNKCKESLDYSEFAKNCSQIDGYENYCKSCKNKYNQAKYGNKYTKLYHKKAGYGIYKIENKKNGEIYIGKGWLNERKVDHFTKLKAQRHSNQYLQESYNNVSHELLEFSVIEICEPNLGSLKERYYIIEEYLKNSEKLLNQHVTLRWRSETKTT